VGPRIGLKDVESRRKSLAPVGNRTPFFDCPVCSLVDISIELSRLVLGN
jgi:hypothetical protein